MSFNDSVEHIGGFGELAVKVLEESSVEDIGGHFDTFALGKVFFGLRYGRINFRFGV